MQELYGFVFRFGLEEFIGLLFLFCSLLGIVVVSFLIAGAVWLVSFTFQFKLTAAHFFSLWGVSFVILLVFALTWVLTIGL